MAEAEVDDALNLRSQEVVKLKYLGKQSSAMHEEVKKYPDALVVLWLQMV